MSDVTNNVIMRASPVQLRKALILAQTFVNAGILFVPIPVFSEEEANEKAAEVDIKLKQLELSNAGK